MFNLDTTKRAARQEAWHGPGTEWNPFSKTTRRSSTFPAQVPDEEALRGEPALRTINTENGPRSSASQAPFFNSQNAGTAMEMQDLEKSATNNGGRPSDPSTEATMVGGQSSRQPSVEEKARRRFLSRFTKKGREEVDGEEKKKKGGIFRGKDIKHEPFTLRSQLQNTIFNSWINVLLIAAPIGIALNYAGGVNGIVIFVVNFIAIIPLAAMLGFATEEIALHVGESLGGLLNATFGYVSRMAIYGLYGLY